MVCRPLLKKVLLGPKNFFSALRKKGPFVYLRKYKMLAYGRCKATKEVFSDYKRFVSLRGVGIQDFIDTKDLAKEIYKSTTVKLKEDQLAGMLIR